MNISNLISIIAFSLIAILIFTKYIYIKKPFNYITILVIIIPNIIIQTPISNYIKNTVGKFFVPLYTLVGLGIIFAYCYSTKINKK